MSGKATVQLDLFGAKDPLAGFERPEYHEKDYPQCKGSEKKPMKDLNYFYVDFYGRDDLFQRLTLIMKKRSGIRGLHRVNPELFEQMVLSLEGDRVVMEDTNDDGSTTQV